MIGIISFIAGYALLGFVCYVAMADVSEWTRVHYHLWGIVVIDYALLFGTMFFSKFISKSIDGKIATWIFDWPARVCLAIILAISAGLGFYVDNFSICLIIDGCGIFIYLLALCLTEGTAKHIQSVQVTETHNRILIDEVRKASLSLCIVAKSLSDEYANEKKQIEAIEEELRYLSPSSSLEARKLEESILNQLKEIKNDCMGSCGIIAQRLTLLNACIAERKNIY